MHAECQQRLNDSETGASWLVGFKQQLTDMKGDAKKDLELINAHENHSDSGRRKPSVKGGEKKNKKRNKKKVKDDDSTQGSDDSDDDSDGDDASGDRKKIRSRDTRSKKARDKETNN